MHARKKIVPLAIKASPGKLERRANQRFPLRCPAVAKFGGNGMVRQIDVLTENVSTGGILLECAGPIPRNSEIEFVITIREAPKSFRLKGVGYVVRLEERVSGREFHIAVKCKHPLRILSAVRSPSV